MLTIVAPVEVGTGGVLIAGTIFLSSLYEEGVGRERKRSNRQKGNHYLEIIERF